MGGPSARSSATTPSSTPSGAPRSSTTWPGSPMAHVAHSGCSDSSLPPHTQPDCPCPRAGARRSGQRACSPLRRRPSRGP
eukprot:6153571-Lingulodinium_polyedra.AAC.1